jgi:inner membrane protein YhjD
MAWTTSDRVMRYRRRSALVDIAVEVLDGWRRHLTGRNAAVLTYYGFLSIFPLFLVATTVLGIVLRNNESLRERILDTAVAQIPVIGPEIERNAGELSGGPAQLVIGLGIALWASTKAFVAVQHAFDDAWEVHVDDRDGLPVKRGKALLGVFIIGGALIASVALSSIASLADLHVTNRILLLVGTLAINVGVLALMYRLMTTASPSWRTVLPGAVLAGIAFTALQVLGTWIVELFLRNSSDTSAVFASVFALFAWLNLHATSSLVGAELNAALDRRT